MHQIWQDTHHKHIEIDSLMANRTLVYSLKELKSQEQNKSKSHVDSLISQGIISNSIDGVISNKLVQEWSKTTWALPECIFQFTRKSIFNFYQPLQIFTVRNAQTILTVAFATKESDKRINTYYPTVPPLPLWTDTQSDTMQFWPSSCNGFSLKIRKIPPYMQTSTTQISTRSWKFFSRTSVPT